MLAVTLHLRALLLDVRLLLLRVLLVAHLLVPLDLLLPPNREPVQHLHVLQLRDHDRAVQVRQRALLDRLLTTLRRRELDRSAFQRHRPHLPVACQLPVRVTHQKDLRNRTEDFEEGTERRLFALVGNAADENASTHVQTLQDLQRLLVLLLVKLLPTLHLRELLHLLLRTRLLTRLLLLELLLHLRVNVLVFVILASLRLMIMDPLLPYNVHRLPIILRLFLALFRLFLLLRLLLFTLFLLLLFLALLLFTFLLLTLPNHTIDPHRLHSPPPTHYSHSTNTNGIRTRLRLLTRLLFYTIPPIQHYSPSE